jgi:deoxycytidylate deaminase
MSDNDLPPVLAGFELYGWKPDPSRSRDCNYMDLCMIVTRNSQLRQGSMACILVRGEEETTAAANGDKAAAAAAAAGVTVDSIYNDILMVANNMPFYSKNDSEIHAEVAAIGKASRQGLAIEGATAYITMPPCKRCLPALSVAGIKRIVSRHPLFGKLLEAISANGMVYDKIDDQEERIERVNKLVKDYKERKREAETNAGEGEEEQQEPPQAKKQKEATDP